MNAPNTRFQTLATLCKGSGDPLRLEILRALKTDSFGVLELCDIFDVKQSGMSHHLKVLANAGSVTTRREGNSIFYRRPLIDQSRPEGHLLAALFTCIDQIPINSDTFHRIAEVKSQRADSAKAFFNKHAGDFQAQQELIAHYDQYAESAKELLLKDIDTQHQTLLEIGPGEGAFLADIAPYFCKVVALDISEEMLEKAKTRCIESARHNIDFVLGNTYQAVQQGQHFNHIVCNMVLHHVPSPADVFLDSAQLMQADGSLVVTDLCRHDQSWVKDNCGDLWLGFEPDEISEWAQAANLTETDSLYLGLRNGFQIQVRKFTHLTSTPSISTP